MTFLEWLPNARPGDRFTYFVGELARERAFAAERTNTAVEPEMRAALDQADDAWRAHEYGDCLLVQRRKSAECFEYQAIKRR
jgi:hypothetical protein